MVNIYRSRRGRFLKCRYWKRDENTHGDNEEITHNVECSGFFYAKAEGSKNKDTQDIANAWHVGFEDLTISTEDPVNIKKDDLVEIGADDLYIVEAVNDRPIQKTAEFGKKPTYVTRMVLRHGV